MRKPILTIAMAFAVAAPCIALGQATGKRIHKPVTILKEWGAATP
jgi:hypothetical protein